MVQKAAKEPAKRLDFLFSSGRLGVSMSGKIKTCETAKTVNRR